MQGVSISSILNLTLKSVWGEKRNEYVNFVNKQDKIENAVEIVVLAFRDVQNVSFDITVEDLDLLTRNFWINEIIQKDEFLELAKKEAKIRYKRLKSKKSKYEIAFESVVSAVKNVHKDIEWRKNGKRTYAKAELVSIVASSPGALKNEKVSKRLLAHISKKALEIVVKNRMKIRNLDDLLKLKELCELENIEFYNSSLPAIHIQKQNQNQQLTLF